MALTDDLKAFWELEEASGTRVDAHGSNDLTDNATVGQGSGIVGNCADFESGNSEFLDSNSTADLQVANQMTLQAWIKLESKSADQHFVGKWASPTPEYILYYAAAGDRFKFTVYTGGFPTATADNLGAPNTGQWYCVHAWVDVTGTAVGIAVDAGTADTSALASPPAADTGDFSIGASDGASFADALIDQVGKWDRVLTSGERTSLHNSGAGLSYAAMSGGGGGGKTVGSLPLLGIG